MIRAGLIWNQKSHRNRGAGRGPLPPDVLDIVPEDPAELDGGLRRLAQAGADLVVVDGGDGTIREVLSRLPEAFEGRLPRLAVLPNGKTNALALDIETPLGTTLEQILAAAEAGRPVKQRQCLEIVRRGAPAPEHRGFLFGAGAFVRATELAQRNHGLGFFDNAAIAVTLGGAIVRTLAGGADEPWRRGEAGSLSLAPEVARWFLVMASTLKRFPLGLRPYGVPREGLKVLSVAAPPRRLPFALPILLRGRDAPWLAEAGYRRDDLPAFGFAFDGEYVLDGERYSGGDLTVRQGPALEFVIP
ncbi:diacylglycerol kinase family protein [Phenylobacterium sp.]|uniref:diacylglycerol/lipid kinase family protein n=1 Tax=Phenylobacterium sp. TaxID=1871053 RepID=UPI00301BE426